MSRYTPRANFLAVSTERMDWVTAIVEIVEIVGSIDGEDTYVRGMRMEKRVNERESIDDVFLVGDDDRDSQADKYLLFDIGDEVYGIAIAHVTEIIEMQKVTQVPDMPDFVKGVINLRGKVNPVIDMRLRFGMTEREYDDRTCIIVVNVDDTSLGFIVDTVAEVHDIAEANIDPVPNFNHNKERNRYVSGLGKIEDRVAILIDTEKILDSRQLETITAQPDETSTCEE